MIPWGWMIPLCIVSGNTFVLKAASMVPTSSIRLLELLQEAGLPKGVVNVVTCSRKEAELLLTHPLVRGVSFVGSTDVGRHVYSVAAAHGKRVQAQTEAKNHGLVLADASLERAAAGIINSTFGCAGMRCMALPVCVVENSVADEFIGYMKKFAEQRIVGCSYDPKTELGPVVSAEHQAFIKGWIDKGVDEGADLVLDGRGLVVPGYEKGFFVGPTIFDNVNEDMTVGRDEIFGPVLAIKRVEDFEEGITIMNASRFANGSCIFTESGYYAREFARRTNAGMVGVNVGIPVRSASSPSPVTKTRSSARATCSALTASASSPRRSRDVALVHRSGEEAEEGRHLGGHHQPVGSSISARRESDGGLRSRANSLDGTETGARPDETMNLAVRRKFVPKVMRHVLLGQEVRAAGPAITT